MMISHTSEETHSREKYRVPHSRAANFEMPPKGSKRAGGTAADDRDLESKAGGKRGDEGAESAEVRLCSGERRRG